MAWIVRYRIRQYLAHSMWIGPLASMLLGIFAVRVTRQIDGHLGWTSTASPDAFRSVLITLAGVVFTLVVFISSAMLIALQLASAQLTPRIIAMIFRDHVAKAALSLFMFTFAFSMTSAVWMGSPLPLVTARVAMYSSVLCLGVFLFLVEHLGKSLRPVSVLRRIARQGRRVVKAVYPRRIDRSGPPPADPPLNLTGTCRTVLCPSDGAVLAFDIDGLRALAQRERCVIELVPQVGDFIAIGDPLFRVFEGGDSVSERQLQNSVAIGQERTLEQDPTFAFRMMVDVATKALSPAINDPTTAVLAIDQIHRMLREVGWRSLKDERLPDASGRLRLAYRTPDWDDYVRLAATEIRHFGGDSIQIVRRLRAMLLNLIQTLPAARVELLRRELRLLDKSIVRGFAEPEDQSLAQIGDSQGVGGRGHQAALDNDVNHAVQQLVHRDDGQHQR